MAKPSKVTINHWKKIVKDPNIGYSVKQYYRKKLREAGEKIEG